MHVIVLAVELHELCSEIVADALEDGTHRIEDALREEMPAIFCNEDQVNVQSEDTVSSGA